MIQFYEYFKTPVYWENLSHWTDDINKHCDKHIDAAKKLQSYKDRVKEKKSDFGEVAHSAVLQLFYQHYQKKIKHK
jgi:hypothetical protein